MIRSALPAIAFAAAAALVPGPVRAADSEWHLVAYINPELPFNVREVPLHPAPGGFALAVVNGLWNLVPATLTATVTDRDGKGHPQSVAIVASPADAVAYVRLPGLAEGKVDTPDMRFKGVERDISRKTVAVPFKSVPYVFELGKRGASVLTDGVTRQQVVEPGLAKEGSAEEDMHSVTLLWAGDLDRDGKLDFIVSDWFDDGGTMCVWLSSKAAPGQLAGKAACMDRAY